MSERVRPFTNGSSYDLWNYTNCLGEGDEEMRCTKCGTCGIRKSLTAAKFGDGTVPIEIARRIGSSPQRRAPEPRCREYTSPNDHSLAVEIRKLKNWNDACREAIP